MDESKKSFRSPVRMLGGLVFLGGVLIGGAFILGGWASEKSELNATIQSLKQELNKRDRLQLSAGDEIETHVFELKNKIQLAMRERDIVRLQLAVNRVAIGAARPKDTKSALMDIAGLRNVNKEFKQAYQEEMEQHQKYLNWDPDSEEPESTYVSRIRELDKQLAAERLRNKELTEALEKVKKDR